MHAISCSALLLSETDGPDTVHADICPAKAICGWRHHGSYDNLPRIIAYRGLLAGLSSLHSGISESGLQANL